MGFNIGFLDNHDHKDLKSATPASAPSRNPVADATNPRAALKRREAEADPSPASKPDASDEQFSGGMSQPQFSGYGKKKSSPPAAMLKRHDEQ